MTEPGSAHVEGQPDVEPEGSPTDVVSEESNDAGEAATDILASVCWHVG